MVPVGALESDSVLSAAELLELLGDEYARRVLEAIADVPASAKGIANETGISTPTVYRRLDRLEECGLVRSEIEFDVEGNHFRRYSPTLEAATLQLDDDGISVTVRMEPYQSDRRSETISDRRPEAASDQRSETPQEDVDPVAADR